MKRFIFCGLAFGVVAASDWHAQAQQTGKEALAVLTKGRGTAAASEVVQVTGERGQDQPQTWRLIAKDPEFPGRFREYTVSKGKLVHVAPVPPAESGSFPISSLVTRRIKVDSTLAFARADAAAKKALIGFDSLSYDLRNAEFSQSPVWVVRLADQQGSTVGELVVSAESGNVLRRSWTDAGRTPAIAAVPAVSSTASPPRGSVSQPTASPVASGVSQKAQQVWEGTRHGLQQGTSAVKTGLTRAGDSVRDWIGRTRGTAPATPSAPVQTSGPSTWESGTYDSSRR